MTQSANTNQTATTETVGLGLAAPAVVPKSLAKQMSGIEWTDFTCNWWGGCTQVRGSNDACDGAAGLSGCDICYAKFFGENRLDLEWGPGAERRVFKSTPAKMRRLDRLAEETGLPFAVFGFSLADWLDPEAAARERHAFMDLVEDCRHLTWLLLTHRPHLFGKLAGGRWDPVRGALPENVWPGVTLDRAAHAKRWYDHRAVFGDTGRAWISAEPLLSSLEGVDLSGAASLIAGGASNTNDPRYAADPSWLDELIERRNGDLHLKQWGNFGEDGQLVGKKAAGRSRRGQTYDALAWATHRPLLKAAAAGVA